MAACRGPGLISSSVRDRPGASLKFEMVRSRIAHCRRLSADCRGAVDGLNCTASAESGAESDGIRPQMRGYWRLLS